MKLSRQDRKPALPAVSGTPTATETEDLVFHVSRLADCLGRASHGSLDQQSLVVAYQAISAALDAEEKMARMADSLARLERMAMTDPLTGLLNRRGFEADLKRTLAAARRYTERGALIYIDLDEFKAINDTHGHEAGDAVLVAVADALGRNVRDGDRVARLGGDEFCVLLTRVDREVALIRAETLDRIVNGIAFDWQGATIRVRASLGFQPFGPDDHLKDLLGNADRAMYAAKRLRAEMATRPPAEDGETT